MLARQIEDLVVDASRRTELGTFGRRAVTERFSLQRAIGVQLDIYRQVLANPPQRNLSEAIRSARLALMLEYANHDPGRKRRKRDRESAILSGRTLRPLAASIRRELGVTESTFPKSDRLMSIKRRAAVAGS